jgi:hypothetical protein
VRVCWLLSGLKKRPLYYDFPKNFDRKAAGEPSMFFCGLILFRIVQAAFPKNRRLPL